jgi:CubicO group peptidase (beta-lactamase class C family)
MGRSVRRGSFAVVALAVSGTAAGAGADRAALPTSMIEAIDRSLAPWSAPDAPGVALAVVRGEAILLARGYGSADPERGIPIEPDTLFDAASIAKTFTGLGVGRLLATHAVDPLDLDADLRPRIDALRGLPASITVRHLLHHTSGLRDWPGGIVLAGGDLDDRIDTARVLGFIGAQRALNSAPGERHSYTNSGYVLLARWIELETGEAFPQWMRRSIFEPLGMHATLVPDVPGAALAKAAVGHRRVGERWVRLPRNSAVWGSSGLWTSALDLARFMIELGRRQALPPLAFGFLEQRGRKLDGGEIGYGAGVQFGVQPGPGKARGYLEHGGSWSGFRSVWRWFPEERVGVAVLSNFAENDVGTIASRIATLVLDPGAEAVRTSSLSEEQRARLTGRYRYWPGLDLEVFEVRGELQARGTGQGAIPLTALSPSELVSEGAGIRFVFELPREGPATGIVAHQHGRETEVPRVVIEDGPVPAVADPDELRLVTGSYPLSDEKELGFRVESGALVAQATGEATCPTRRLSRDRFFIDAYGSEVRFRRDVEGRATGLTYRGLDLVRREEIALEALAPYEGIYRSAELATEYRIAVVDRSLVAEHPRHGRIPLAALGDGRFRGSRWFFRDVIFDGAGDRPRERLRVSFDRVENVVFDRVTAASAE